MYFGTQRFIGTLPPFVDHCLIHKDPRFKKNSFFITQIYICTVERNKIYVTFVYKWYEFFKNYCFAGC